MPAIQSQQDWLEGPERLEPLVKQLFLKATKQYAPPTEQGCRVFAQYLHALGPPGHVAGPPEFRKLAVHHGQLFLTHIARERQVLELGLNLARVLEPDADLEAKVKEFKDMISRIEEVQLHLDVLLPYLSYEPTEPIRFLAQLARDLWAESNQRQMPLWKKPDDPLCKLLSEALAGIGRPLAPATISEILRGRRRNW